jgi:predicted HTH domain antitoxin
MPAGISKKFLPRNSLRGQCGALYFSPIAATMESMEAQIAIRYPFTLAHSLKMREREFEREMKTLSLVKLYELGKVSGGYAARVLGISRIAFLDILAEYQVSCFPDADELESDFANAEGSADLCPMA